MSGAAGDDLQTIALECVRTIYLDYARPFEFRHTFWKPSHFRTDLECHSWEASWRTFNIHGTLCGVRFELRSSRIRATVFSNTPLSAAVARKLRTRLVHAYGLHEDIRPFLRLAKQVPAMRLPLRRFSGMRMSCPENVFEIAIISLLLQNTTVARSTQMMRSLLMHYGHRVRFDGHELMCFFSPQDILHVTEKELRDQCRLGYRAKYLSLFASYFATHDPERFLKLSRERVFDELQSIRGVGPYTAGIIESHAFRRTDSVGLDSWNRKIAAKALLGKADAPVQGVRAKLKKQFPAYEGTALMYLVENEFIDAPVVPLIDVEARPGEPKATRRSRRHGEQARPTVQA
jgi:3-methyladenine DNA glycosylase/8-oxoguanine DNA glycosylase